MRGAASAAALAGALAWVLVAAAFARAEAGGAKGAVVLLHGLGRSSRSMEPLAERLQRSGYVVHNVDYPSTEHSVEELVALLAQRVEACCAEGSGPLHFVTHSLGGILVRAYLLDQRPPRLGRVVMLAPPSQGSEWVDRLREYALFESALGPAATQLGTDPASVPNRLRRLGPVDYPLGIVAGTGSVNPLAALVVPEPNDGTVAAERTRVEGMTDYWESDASHTFIMQDPEVMRQVLYFLQHGRFDHREGEAVSP